MLWTLNEPTAAALAYGFGHSMRAQPRRAYGSVLTQRTPMKSCPWSGFQ
jgi:hypothetical protein